MAVVERARAETGLDVETMWTDDGFVVRFPETDEPPDPQLMMPGGRRGRSAGAAAARRHGAVRGEVPRSRRPGAAAAEAPAGRPQPALAAAQARRRSARGRGALRIVPDAARGLPRVPARRLRHARRSSRRCAASRAREIRAVTVDSAIPSPFAVGAAVRLRRQLHLRRRRAARGTARAGAGHRSERSCASCSAKPSCASCSTHDALAQVEAQLQQLDATHQARSADGVHDLLLRLGDLTADGDRRRAAAIEAAAAVADAGAGAPRRRPCSIAGEPRYMPVEDAGRYRDALGVPLPPGLPESLLQPSPNAGARPGAPLRAHARAVHHRRVRRALRARPLDRASCCSRSWRSAGRLLEGEFRPGGTRPRMVRPRRAAVDPPALAGEAAQGSRAGRAAGARPADHDVAGRRPQARGTRRAARRDREPAGRAAAGVDLRDARSSRRASRATTRPISTR